MVLFENYPKNTRITLLYHILNYSWRKKQLFLINVDK
jgi:hypothetical protein